jgi:hypothetical protein
MNFLILILHDKSILISTEAIADPDKSAWKIMIGIILQSNNDYFD